MFKLSKKESNTSVMTATLGQFYKCTKQDMTRAGLAGADAFQDDPMWKSILESELKEKLALCLEMTFLHCWKYGVVYGSDDSLEGLIAVVPGKYFNMNMWRMLMSGSFPLMGKIGSTLGKKMDTCFTPMIKDQKKNMNGRDYIYLTILSVKKERQGKGIGGKLLRSVIDGCDQEGLPIYLETEILENVQMYEHFGFEIVKKITLPEINCPVWEMMREPK
jgi:ribosomal protein S18 acetylase RimI-like enzyme